MFAWVLGGRPPVRFDEVWRAGLGSLAAVALTGVVGWFLSDRGLGALLVGPVGASAVLLFAAPASPLAQPRSVIGGNVISALVGVACAQFVPEPILAAALAVSLAIVAMSVLGCLHPPGGAMALTAVVGGPAVAALGYGFVLVPAAMCSLLLVVAAVGLNRLMGRSYPHRVPLPASPHATSDPTPLNRVGFKAEDLDPPWPNTAPCWTSAARTSTPCSARSSSRLTGGCTRPSSAARSCPAM